MWQICKAVQGQPRRPNTCRNLPLLHFTKILSRCDCFGNPHSKVVCRSWALMEVSLTFLQVPDNPSAVVTTFQKASLCTASVSLSKCISCHEGEFSARFKWVDKSKDDRNKSSGLGSQFIYRQQNPGRSFTLSGLDNHPLWTRFELSLMWVLIRECDRYCTTISMWHLFGHWLRAITC